jgi:hypothetical protein
VALPRGAHVVADSLVPLLTVRSVDRRPYRRTPLTPEQKAAFAAAIGNAYEIDWHESLAARWHTARINARATDIRLSIPEAFEVHREVVDWERNFSPTGIPGATIGLDPVARRLTRWLMRDWRRLHAANRLGGTALARLEMDLIPGIFCAAHFTVLAKVRPEATAQPQFLLAAGEALQRFWLTATRFGLVMQPSLAPLCFAHYGRAGTAFTQDRRIREKAHALAAIVDRDAAASAGSAIFGGRLGVPAFRRVTARSMRRELLHSQIEERSPACTRKLSHSR